MAVTQYIGARYVPLFADPIEWSSTKSYEPLTVVTYQGASYTSRQAVPVGIDIANTEYWVLTGNYNAQVEQYRQEVRSFDGRITQAQSDASDALQQVDTVSGDVADLDAILAGYGEGVTVKSDVTALQDAIDTLDSKVGTLPEGETSVVGYVDGESTALAADIDAVADALNAVETESQPISIDAGYIETLSGSDLYSYYILATIPRSYKVSQAIRNGSVSDYSGRTYDYVKRSTDALLANGALYGPIVSKGQVKMNAGTTEHHSSYSHILCFDANNEPTVIADVDQLAQASSLLSQGYVETIPCFCPVVTNGVPQAFVGNTELLEKHTREVFAWDEDNWYLLVIEGRNPRSIGATYTEMQLMCAYLNLSDAVMLDGGGSTELWVPATLQNLVFANSERLAAGYTSRYIDLLTFNEE